MKQDNRSSPNVVPDGQGAGPPNMRPDPQPKDGPHPIDDRRDRPSPDVERAVRGKVIER